MHMACACMPDQQFCYTRSVKLQALNCCKFIVASLVRELSLVVHTSLLEMKPSSSLLFIDSWSRSEKGRGGQLMSSELSNKAFSMKSIQYIC